ncbi:MAG: hypothetical protein AAFY71_07615 [Bacteroidota bacterium]
MKRVFWTILLLLLLAGGVIWYIRSGKGDRFAAYISKDVGVAATVHTGKFARILASEKIGNGGRLNALFKRFKEEKGINLMNREGNDNGLDLLIAPMICTYPRQNVRVLHVILDDRDKFEAYLRDRWKIDFQQNDSLRYAYLAERRAMLAWNEEVVLLAGNGDENQLYNHLANLFFLKEKDKWTTELFEKARKGEGEITALFAPSSMGLSDSLYAPAEFSASFEDGGLEVELILTPRNKPLVLLEGPDVLSHQDSELPLELGLAIEPAFLRSVIPPSDREAIQEFLSFWEGNFYLQIKDTISAMDTVITYEYDDNFNKVEVQRTKRKVALAGGAFLPFEDEMALEALIVNMADKNLIQGNDSLFQLLDVFEQNIFGSKHDPQDGSSILAFSTERERETTFIDMGKRQERMKESIDQLFLSARVRPSGFDLLSLSQEDPEMQRILRQLGKQQADASLLGTQEGERLFFELEILLERENENVVLGILELILEADVDTNLQ